MSNLREVSAPSAGKDEQIYRYLLTAISEVQLPPGTKLPEDALAETFGVSRTGVRKVLQRLALERLVTLMPNKGASVARPSVQEAREVFDARRKIECSTLPDAIGNARPADLRRLRALLREEDQAQLAQDRVAAIRLSGEFHQRLIALSGNQLLAEFLRELVVRSSLIIATYGAPIAVSCRHSDHEQIVDLIEDSQVKAAVEWMHQHLEDVENSCIFSDQEESTPDLKQVLRGIVRRR